jgi:preprotein translocase subunit SecG
MSYSATTLAGDVREWLIVLGITNNTSKEARMFWLVLAIFIILCVLLAVTVLMQEPKQGGLGTGLDGGSSDFTSSRGVAGGLHRVTIILGVLWGIFALLLNIVPR